MPVITFLPSYRKITVGYGTTILDAARLAGFQMNVVCGGQGKCGKCVVFVKAGDASFDREKFGRFFSGEELEAGGCLGCQATVLGDLQVLIPESSLIQEQKILIEALGLETAFLSIGLEVRARAPAPHPRRPVTGSHEAPRRDP